MRWRNYTCPTLLLAESYLAGICAEGLGWKRISFQIAHYQLVPAFPNSYHSVLSLDEQHRGYPSRNGPISFVSHSMHRQKPVTGMQRRGDAKQSVKQGLHLLNCHWDDTIALIVNVFTCERDAGGCALAVLDAQQINTGCCLLTNWSSIKWFTNGICKSGPAWKQFIKMVQHGSSSNLLTTSLPMRLTRPARHGTQSQSSGIQLCTGEALRVVYLHQPGARAYNSGSAPKFLLNVLCSSL